MDAIFFVLRTWCHFNALNATGICSSSSSHRRFQEWTAASVFVHLWAQGLQEYVSLQCFHSALLAIDFAITLAPLCPERTGTNPTNRSKSRTKLCLLTEAYVLPLFLSFVVANRYYNKLV